MEKAVSGPEPARTDPAGRPRDGHGAGGAGPVLDAATIRQALAGVQDPELGAGLVELGMIREVAVEGSSVTVEVALTMQGCPLRTRLRADVEAAVRQVPGVEQVTVRFGLLDAEERRALMATARRRAQERAPATSLPARARVLLVTSGKGGVGKSSVAVNLAAALARPGQVVGLLDADIWGFSVPRLLGMDGRLEAAGGKIQPRRLAVGDGELRVVSMGFLAEEDTAVLWRGLKLSRAVQQFLEDVAWDGVDLLVIDAPPGTGDVPMALARLLPRSEVLVVTTPPLAAQQVAARAADLARRHHLRVSGVIENMAGFVCEHGSSYPLFGEGGGERLADALGVPLLGSVPFDPAVAVGGDRGELAVLGPGPAGTALRGIAERLRDDPQAAEAASCAGRLLDAVERAVAGVARG
ncbi:P-loop NTPase [Aciditerrimonas ferrireducens]|uniref:P-loop NTPase n=1 Tax=Aciditerrimonas ferrireducens TaxID=667306 RepID=UPI00289663C6|nr:P-loop NTPase [Aciditerrimonas ferrireducens]